mgnify:FL=1
MPIGGLKEKLLAAVRGGIRKALIPEENVKDLADLPPDIKDRIEVVPVKWFDQVLQHALERAPEPLPETSEPAPAVAAAGAEEDAAVSGVIKH